MRFGYWFLQLICQLTFLTAARGRAIGLRHVPRKGPLLLLANHQCYLDPVLVALALPRECHYMARENLFKEGKWTTRLIRYLNAFPVRRASADLGAVKEALRRVRGGGALVMFPEGTRTADGGIGPFLPGFASIAQRARCPIVPTLLVGAHEFWPRDRTFPTPCPVRVHYGRPLQPAMFADWPPERLADEIRRRLCEMQQDVDDRYRIRNPGVGPAGDGPVESA